jgi:ADP-ribose pyrophosphatase YjhB (NUDIX family)
MKRKSKILFFFSHNAEISILLGKRVLESGESFWWLPGGSVEGEENLFEAGSREVREELIPYPAMQRVLDNFLQSAVFPPFIEFQSGHASTFVFFIQLNIRMIPGILDEFEEIKWFDLKDLPENMSREYVYLKEYISPDYFSGLPLVIDFGRYY